MKQWRFTILMGLWLGTTTALGVVGAPAALAKPIPVEGGGVTVGDCVSIGLPVIPNAPGTCPGKDAQGNTQISNDPATGGAVINYLRQWLFLLNLLVPGVILLMIIISGVQYITAGANPTSVKSAKSRLINSMIALVLYLMMFAILQMLVPGGIL